MANDPKSNEVKIFTTYPVRYTWDDLNNLGKVQVFYHQRRLKAFIIHRFLEFEEKHSALIVWNFDLEKGFDAAYIKREIVEAAPKINFNTMFEAPKIRHASFLGGDLAMIEDSNIGDKNYDQGHLSSSFNRTSLVLKGLTNLEMGEICLNKLENDPPQVVEEEEFKLEFLKAI